MNVKSNLSDAQSTKLIATASFTALWLNLLLLPSSLLKEEITGTVLRTDPSTALSVISVLTSHPPIPQFSISFKLSPDWAYVPVKVSITMQRIIVTQFLINSFFKFFKLALITVFVLQLLLFIHSLGTPLFYWLFLIYSTILFISDLQPSFKPPIYCRSC